MNVKLLAAGVLLLESDTFLVSDNNKLAYALQTVDILVFGWRYTGRYLQLSNVEPTQDCSAPADSQLNYGSL